MDTTEQTKSALVEHCSKLQPDLRVHIREAADRFSTRDAAISNLLEEVAHLQFLHSSGVPADENAAWTNNDFKRACERLIERLQAIIDSTPQTRF
jgi:hypothetical protein